MILRIVAMAFGLAGGASLSQFPEFAQQYLQRLAGKVDQLEVQVSEINAAAASFDMSREAYLADLGSSRTGAAAADRAAAEIALFERLEPNVESFREANAFGRLSQLHRVADVDLAQRTFEDYEPAVPLTTEGAVFAGAGFVAGWGLWSILVGLIALPFRRRRRRRDAERLLADRAASESEDARYDEDEDEPAVEYEGDIRNALDAALPPLTLRAHDGSVVELTSITAPVVIFTYPLLGRPGVPYPDGWEHVDDVENATALACSFRDAIEMLLGAGIKDIFGISSQATEDQREAAHRLALPFALLSDPGMEFTFALNAPRVVVQHQSYMGAAVLLAKNGQIVAGLVPGEDASQTATKLLQRLEELRSDPRREAAS